MEQGLKIRWQRSTISMYVTDELVEIISKSAKLRKQKPSKGFIWNRLHGMLGMFVEHEGTTEMNRAHANGCRTFFDPLKLRCRQAEIKLHPARFCICGPSHPNLAFLGRAQASWGLGAIRAAPNEKPFA